MNVQFNINRNTRRCPSSQNETSFVSFLFIIITIIDVLGLFTFLNLKQRLFEIASRSSLPLTVRWRGSKSCHGLTQVEYKQASILILLLFFLFTENLPVAF